MKFLKWALPVLLILAIIAAVLQWRRDTIALDIANRALRETNFVVVSVSVRTLAVDHIELSSIVLETPGATRYEIAGLDFPLAVQGTGPRGIRMESLVISPADGEAEAGSYTDLVRTALAMPETLANTDVRVERLTFAAVPELSGINWTTSGRGQTLALEVMGLAISIAVTQPAADTHEARIVASDSTGAEALRGAISFIDRDQRIGVDGEMHVDLAVLEPVLHALEWVPMAAESLLASVDGRIAVELDAGGAGQLAIRMEATLLEGSSLTWRAEDDTATRMKLVADTALDIAVGYPDLRWTLDAPQLRGALLLDDGNAVTTTLNDLHCQAGVRCTAGAAASMAPGRWEDIAVKSIDVTQASGITFSVGESGWSAKVEKLDVAVDELVPFADLHTSLSFVVTDVELTDGLSSIVARFSSSPGIGQLRYGDVTFPVPGTEGTFTFAGESLTSSLRLFDKARSLGATVAIDYDTARALGSMKLRDGVIDFGRRKLSQRIAPWSYPFDLVAGTWNVAADLDWAMTPAGVQYRGHSTQQVAGLAGLYNEIGMAGLATTLEVDIDSSVPLSVQPALASVDPVDVGVPINRLSAKVTLDVENLAARVEDLAGAVLGGRFRVDPFTYALAAETNQLQVRLDSVQPQFMVDLAEFEQLKITGTMSGMLPVTLVGNAVRIDSGQMSNDPPGGVIRYKGDAAAAGVSSGSQLSIVTGALSNFVYDSLTARVDYTEAGDLKLGMRLKGINPDRDPTQPIILNLNVDNNIPQMLRSLQAVRSIEDIIERRTAD